MPYYVYKLTCPDGKYYIGQTKTTIQRRKAAHYYNRKLASWHSFDKHLENFKVKDIQDETLKICESQEELDRVEQEQIIHHKYNLETGKADPNCLNLQINSCLLKSLQSKNESSISPEIDTFIRPNLKCSEEYGTEKHYLYEKALEYYKKKYMEKLQKGELNPHEDLVYCEYCKFYCRSFEHTFHQCSTKNYIMFINEYKNVLEQDDAEWEKYDQGYKQFIEDRRFEISCLREEIKQLTANLKKPREFIIG